MAALVSIPLAVQTLETHWSGDVWLHAASILELSEHPFDPRHPTVAVDVGDPDLSPYTLVWGVVDRVTGRGVLTVMTIAGFVNLTAVWAGLWMLSSRLTRARLAPAFTIPAVLLVWGFGPWRWSGYANLNSLGFGLPYPAFAAFAAYLVALAVFVDWLREPSWRGAWTVAGLGAFATLAHPITGAALAVGALTLLVVAMRDATLPCRARTAQLAIPGLAALGAVLVWPFSSFVDLVDNAGVYTGANEAVIEDVVPRAVLGLVCLPVAVWLARRRHDWRLVALALAPLVLVAAGVLLDNPVLGRFLPFGLLPLQLALADVVAGAVPAGARARVPRLALGGVLAVAGLVGTASALPRMVPGPLLPSAVREDDRLESIRDQAVAAGALDDGAVVIAPDDDVATTALVSGAKLVAPPYAAPEVVDAGSREAAVTGFLEDSPTRRRDVIREYGVTHLVVTERAAEEIAVDSFGVVESAVDGVVVIHLDGAKDPRTAE